MLTWGKIETYYYYSFKLNSVLEKEKSVSHLAIETIFSQCTLSPFLENIRKPYDFLMFSGGRERVHWEQMN